MLFANLLLLMLAASTSLAATPADSTSTARSEPTAQATPAYSQEQLAALLVERLVEVCAAHPEVERAFVLSRQEPDGSISYIFVPIFDRKVSDEALSEADAVYRALFPSRGYLQLMLLPRNQWKRSLAGVPPVYIRPGK